MGNKKVAIIDNDKKSLRELEHILTLGDYAPVAVNDALSAVDTVIQSQPDVVLVELRMPRKNGFELTDAINRVFDAHRVPVIAMSRFFKDEYNWLLGLCGIRRWLRKPFQPLDVIWAIESEFEECPQGYRERSVCHEDDRERWNGGGNGASRGIF